ncbi:MAG TPA: hypothetical protein VLY85_00445 [Thermoplasmata archaeon]|nr:hypothetical protein [Thermoplasmata archaeon]
MPSRAPLSEEAEREERDDRDRLRSVQAKLRELLERRRLILSEVHRLSDEQEALHHLRRPGDEEVERIHQEYRDLGGQLAETRRLREEARRALDAALIALREYRAQLPRGERARPEEIRKEIAQLELRQQTHALPLPEENALIDHLRKLTQTLALAEKNKTTQEGQHAKLKELEGALAARREEFGRLTNELARLRTERDGRMDSIRGKLVDAGRIVAGIREKAHARGLAMEKLRALGTQIAELERDADRLMQGSRARRQEARKVILDYQRSVRGPMDPETARARAADAQLEELLKRGKVVLRG